MTKNNIKDIIKVNKGGVHMNEKCKYWVQDQEVGLTLEYEADQLEEAIIEAAKLFEGGLNPIIWKMFQEEKRSEELAYFFHEED